MTRPRSDIQLLAIERQHQNLTNVLTPALRHLAWLLTLVDGYPDHTAASSPPTASANPAKPDDQDPPEWTSVERAGNQRAYLHAVVAGLESDIAALAAIYHSATNTCHAILRGANTDAQPPRRCDANGRDGALEWGDFTCDAYPVARGLCDRCRKREDRWREAQGLPRRSAA